MKLCKNCKHYMFRNDRCKHSMAIYHTDPVSGYIHYIKCWRMRDATGPFNKCGVDASLYEEKEPSLLKRMMFWK